ncbi:MAG: quinolinate synthase NadA [Theionarchaea archaeon]|nr:quinolinate synthase NadA [Theionarchaea archaeon]MBU6999317.1 quinolinate synthase NadA [Theionarchaea archaeon]MBU7019558.1 quinolinate synthase NadA [Theionarchaea archaeon]MBU7033736.1 quinolinate synthase NadA [Theionarchaea archaeon]MBU7039454.1 quinolinate synthase NadA [Theionarchaea archaeon]
MDTIILAHNYQRPDVQDRADLTGDSLKLCQIARETECNDIIFCGVDFMAETAAILNPEKRVFMPEPLSQCPMAHQVTSEDILQAKKVYPGALVVAYVNTTAAVKAVSDTICTSANAVSIVSRLDTDTILFTPDRNLGSYVKRFVDKEVIIVPEGGNCPTHHQLMAEDVLLMKENHPQATVAVHPECRPEVIDLADYVGGTEGILNYVKNTDSKEVIIGTENGMLHKIRNECPGKIVHALSAYTVCPNMKMITRESVEYVLREKPVENMVMVDPEVARKAKKAIDAMFELME